MKKKNIILICCIMIVVIVLAISASYAIFTLDITKNTDFKLVIGTLELTITDTSTEDKIIMENTVPTKDEVALNTDGYTFTITNTGTIDSYYTVYLDDILIDGDIDRLDNSYVKINLLNQKTNASTTNMLGDYDSSDRILETGFLKPNESITYTLRMWVDYNVGNEAQNKYFASQIRVVGTQSNAALAYKEEILNGADPVLTDNLIPIKIADDGTVTKADIGTKWYSYEDKEWANAVVLKEESVIDYSGNNKNAITVGNPTYSDNGLVLDGEDDGIYVGNVLSDLFKSSNTFQIKVKRDETNVRDSLLSNYLANSDSDANGLSYEIYSNNKYRVWINYGASDLWNGVAIYNNFILITYVFDKDNNLVNVYEDDTLVATMNSTEYGDFQKDFNKAYIGRDSRTGETSLKGTIERVMIYNDILTLDEIKQNVNTEYAKIGNDNGIVEDNLLLYYDFRKSNVDACKQNNFIIPEDVIESYFVWIPKYSYQLWDLGNYDSLTTVDNTKPHAIPIKFGLNNTSDSNTGECTTPMNEDKTQGLAGESGNCQVGDYMTHPAFLSFNTNGLWVGKFETGYDGATTTSEAQIDSDDSSKIIIKPNVYSWRSLTLGNAFKTSYDYLRNDDSHMIKNTEWGAVAYLQHSSYGSATTVRINNNSNFITGYAATEEPTLGTNGGISVDGNRTEGTIIGNDGTYTMNYLNNLSSIASTTGNKSGIYDMSGGTWEYVSGYTIGASTVGSSSEIISLYSDFYTNIHWKKYYDKYSSLSKLDYNNRILGDATGELGPFHSINKSSWYDDYARFSYSIEPWFARSVDWVHGIQAGIFAFEFTDGHANVYVSFRIVLAPTNK